MVKGTMRCITLNPIITYHGLMKVDSGKARVRNDKSIETLSQIGIWWHPHIVVLPLRRYNPISQIPNKVLTTHH